MSRAGRPLKSDDNSRMTKNALAARENRIKRKNYIQSLEDQAKKLDAEIISLKNINAEEERKTADINRQICSIKGYIAKISDPSTSQCGGSSTSSLNDHCY